MGGIAILAAFLSRSLALPADTLGSLQQPSRNQPRSVAHAELTASGGQAALNKRGAKLVARVKREDSNYATWAKAQWDQLSVCLRRKVSQEFPMWLPTPFLP